MTDPNLSPIEARGLVKVLADGVPPHHPLTRWLTVGQQDLLRQFDDDLSAVTDGGFRSLPIMGSPGAGKSHLLTTLQLIAEEKGLATAYFSQDLQSRLAFNRPDLIYSAVMDQMRLPGGLGAEADATSSVLGQWADRALPALTGTPRSMAISYKLSEIGLLPTETRSIHPRTRVALVGYLMAIEQQNLDAARQMAGVLSGPGLASGDLIRVAKGVGLNRKAFIGYTPSAYDADYYFGQLKTVVFILRVVGYKGLVTLFDEITAIVDLGSRSREKAYKVLDSLFLNKYGYEGLYCVFAYMPAFFTQLRSDRSDIAKDFVDLWQSMWDERLREIVPLTDTELRELFGRLARLHGVARKWNAEDAVRGEVPRLISECRKDGNVNRTFVRKCLAVLDQRCP